jgi:hypothetical protein
MLATIHSRILCPLVCNKNIKLRIYKTIILSVVLCGCETWSLTLREEHRLRVFENKLLRRIFGLKRDEMTGGWRKLHNKLHDLCSLPSIIRIIKLKRVRWAGYVVRMGKKRNRYRLLVGKSPLGRSRHRQVDNIKMDLIEIRWGGVDWSGGNERLSSIKCWETIEWLHNWVGVK